MPIQPWMFSATPAQIFLHDAMEDRRIALREAKGDCEDDISPVMEDRVVIAEVDIVGGNRSPLVFFAEDLARFEYFGDEHGWWSDRCRCQEVQVLPNGTANSARNAHVMLESRPAAMHGLENEILDYRTALGPQRAVVAAVAKVVSSSDVADHEPAKSLITDQNVRAEAEHEVRNVELACDQDGIRELVRRASFEVQIRRAADAKRGIWRENFVTAHSRCGIRCQRLT